MQLCDTKKNHYVPRFYLEQFGDSNSKIYLYDKVKKEIRFVSNPMSIGFENDLYTIKKKLTLKDISLLKKISNVKDSDIIANTTIDLLVSFLNDELGKLVEITVENRSDAAELTDILKKEMIETLDEPDISRNQELLFCEYENSFLPIYNEILASEKISLNTDIGEPLLSYLPTKIVLYVYEAIPKKMVMLHKEVPNIKQEFTNLSRKIRSEITSVNLYDFIHYIVIQRLRVPDSFKLFGSFGNDKTEMKNVFESKYGVDVNNFMHLFIHFSSIVLTNSLIANKFKIILIKNKSKTPFITSDNPSVNPYASIKNGESLTNNEIELYFPLSPKLAVLYSNQCIDPDFNAITNEIEIIDDSKIKYWNDLIAKEATRYIFSDAKAALEKFNP